jgi:hypothetical protein
VATRCRLHHHHHHLLLLLLFPLPQLTLLHMLLPQLMTLTSSQQRCDRLVDSSLSAAAAASATPRHRVTARGTAIRRRLALCVRRRVYRNEQA